MKLKAFCGCLVFLMMSCGAWSLDEAILTPTNEGVRTIEDKAFEAAMKVWYSHKYSDGKRLLKEFAAKYPDSLVEPNSSKW